MMLLKCMTWGFAARNTFQISCIHVDYLCNDIATVGMQDLSRDIARIGAGKEDEAGCH